jgi:molecular chaperone DnaK
MSKVIGIDLGTTNSCVAVMDGKDAKVIENSEGARTTPSMVAFSDSGERLTGLPAKRQAVTNPENTLFAIKRLIGRRFEDKTVEKDKKLVPYNIVKGDNGDAWVEVEDSKYSPSQISAFILQKMKETAESYLGEPVSQAVITVPAYFNDSQRQATKDAGKIAGLEVLRIINEPTAAALAYGLDKEESHTIAVYDLGGGTFDVTVVDIYGNDISVVATAGDDELGGKDFDDVLIKHAATAFEERHGLDPLADPVAQHDLRQKCVSAKLSLSRRPRINLFYDFQGRILRMEITRELFEDLSQGLLARCRRLTEEALSEAGCGPEAIDTVLLAGGSTRMPMVRRLIKDVFGKDPATDINPDECVSLGAALTAALESARLAGEAPPIDIRTHDVTSHSLGMVVFREQKLFNSTIIRRNSRIPCERTRDDYVTTHDGQTSMDLWLVQGEEEDPLECQVLGHFEFYGIPARASSESRLAVTFRYNANGIVEVEAMDLGSGQTLAHRLAASEVTLDDIARNRVPMQLALIVDCSGSMYGTNINEARKAARAFVARTARDSREFAVIAFPGGVKTALTNQQDRVEAAIQALTPIGSTPMHTGLAQARDTLKGKAGVQRVYVILTDGHPDDPEATAAEAHRIKRMGGRVITIGVGRQVKRDFLSALCTNPSDYHHCNESVELEGTFINLATQLGG